MIFFLDYVYGKLARLGRIVISIEGVSMLTIGPFFALQLIRCFKFFDSASCSFLLERLSQ